MHIYLTNKLWLKDGGKTDHLIPSSPSEFLVQKKGCANYVSKYGAQKYRIFIKEIMDLLKCRMRFFP